MSREVPEGWKLHPLTDLAHYINGRAFKPEDWMSSGLPIVRIANMTNSDAAFNFYGGENIDEGHLIQDGDILFSWSATLSIQKWTRGAGVLNQHIFKVVPAASTQPDWLLYVLQNEVERLADQSHGSTMKHIKKGVLKTHQVAVPPPYEQRRIAEILSSVGEAIAATRAVIEQTRKVKQGVLERLLTKGIGHTRFKQTEIGEIPEGWRTGKIGDFFTLQRGFDITEKQSTVGEYPVVSSSGISYFHSEAMVRGPAVITGRKGKLGQVYFIDSSCWPHDTTLWVKDFKGNAPKFVYWFLRSLNLEKFDAATAVPTLNRNVVHALGCAFPPISEQLLIADHLDSIEATEDIQTRNLASYGQTKSALMSDLLTGRKRVTDALPMAAE